MPAQKDLKEVLVALDLKAGVYRLLSTKPASDRREVVIAECDQYFVAAMDLLSRPTFEWDASDHSVYELLRERQRQLLGTGSDRGLSIIQLQAKYGSEHPRHTRAVWTNAALCGETDLAYWKWVALRISQD